MTDIHGCLRELHELVQACLSVAEGSRCQDPHLIFLGDYIDRGPDSAGVLRYLRKLAREHHVTMLLGNHDKAMADAVLGRTDAGMWAANGMSATTLSYGHDKVFRDDRSARDNRHRALRALRDDDQAVDDARFLDSLATSFQDETRYYVHAGIRPTVPLDQQVREDQLWIRGDFLRYSHPHPKYVIHGHTITLDGKPFIGGNRVALDTGCYRTGVLTAAIFTDEITPPVQFISTPV